MCHQLYARPGTSMNRVPAVYQAVVYHQADIFFLNLQVKGSSHQHSSKHRFTLPRTLLPSFLFIHLLCSSQLRCPILGTSPS
jgi:hypothetical protein